MTGVILVAKKSKMIYEMTEVDGDRVHLNNLTNGTDGWLEKEELQKLSVNMKLTSMQEKNPILKQLITLLNLKHETDTDKSDN